ncbi:heme/hemin ABC transporter substrate-binding protein [Pseudooceanicola nanhaiensis]|uniref:heme/hemin ABC transporter substrate-binding protein n=1 Tax=Pseudooceanicola nanhaiensis TaxID=375761 RepID=UPI001CD5992F|nr:hemin ABC transporter substrate-binding protein [Pseudooceanicola nanhaiensis]MCA0922053.1 hemin ABC transporter substrate-binding protein [Pseudooceanicola nanhaiensis]
MRLLRSTALAACLALVAPALWAEPASRIASIGGSVTEIVYALGQQDRLVARDTTSNFPPEAEALPDVGYIRALSPEGLMSVDPDLILTEEGAGPPEAVEMLRAAAIPMIEVPGGHSAEAVRAKILAVGTALEVPEAAQALADSVDAQLAAAAEAAHGTPAKKVLFILSMQGGRILAAGRDTSAEGIITLAGAENALTAFSGYKPVTDEAIAAAAPDVILMMSRGGAADAGHGTADQALSHPALAITPAGQSGAVVRMEGMLLLGFGPRVGEAVTELSAALQSAGHDS